MNKLLLFFFGVTIFCDSPEDKVAECKAEESEALKGRTLAQNVDRLSKTFQHSLRL